MQTFVRSPSTYRAPAPRPLPVRDPDRCAVSSTYWAVTLLLAALEVGQNIDRLARYTGCKRNFVARCARRLVDNGVWKAGETLCEWGIEREAHPSFWKDVAVAEGKLCRRINEQGRYEWIPAGARIDTLDEAFSREEIAPAERYVVPISGSSDIVAQEEGEPRREREAEAEPQQREETGSGRAENSPDPSSSSSSSLPEKEIPRPAAPQDRLRSLFPDAVWLG